MTPSSGFSGKQGRHPRFKSRRGKQSMSYPQRVKVVDGRCLYLPKVGTVRAVLHREVAGRIKTVTVSRTATGNTSPQSCATTASRRRSRRRRSGRRP